VRTTLGAALGSLVAVAGVALVVAAFAGFNVGLPATEAGAAGWSWLLVGYATVVVGAVVALGSIGHRVAMADAAVGA
jgi:hypothetical protein